MNGEADSQSGQQPQSGPPRLARHTELLMREPKKGSTNSATLKEKIVDLYEQLFQVGLTNEKKGRPNADFLKGVKLYEQNEQFWEELFLLRVNLSFLERCISLNSEEQLGILQVSRLFNILFEKYLYSYRKDILQAMFYNCIIVSEKGNKIRVAHALEVQRLHNGNAGY